MKTYEIPLTNDSQLFSIDLGGIEYQFRLYWCEDSLAWIFDISDSLGMAILSGIPLVAGVDLLGPFSYLGFGGVLNAYTDGDLNSSPTYDNLGITGKVAFTTP
jgi:hypothetical protein